MATTRERVRAKEKKGKKENEEGEWRIAARETDARENAGEEEERR